MQSQPRRDPGVYRQNSGPPSPPPMPEQKDLAWWVFAAFVGVFLCFSLAVGASAFNRKIKMSKSTEASRNLAAIFAAETDYYTRHDAPISACQFLACPPSFAGTPRAYRQFGQWSGNWLLLGFGTSDPLYYGYEVTAAGRGADATATITAHGDLDGNGVESNFMRSMSVNTRGEVVGAPLSLTNELE